MTERDLIRAEVRPTSEEDNLQEFRDKLGVAPKLEDTKPSQLNDSVSRLPDKYLPCLTLEDWNPKDGMKQCWAASGDDLEEKEQTHKIMSEDGARVLASGQSKGTDYFKKADGMDAPGLFWNSTDGAITRAGAIDYINDSDKKERSGKSDPERAEFVAALRNVVFNWNNLGMEHYKDANGNITRESLKNGLANLPVFEFQMAAERIEVNQRIQQAKESLRRTGIYLEMRQ